MCCKNLQEFFGKPVIFITLKMFREIQEHLQRADSCNIQKYYHIIFLAFNVLSLYHKICFINCVSKFHLTKFHTCFEVVLERGVESWLRHLLDQVTITLEKLMQQCRDDITNGMPIEEWTFKVIF